jgi:hypothetical protein
MKTYSMGALYALAGVANPTPIPIAFLRGCKVDVKQAKATFRGNMRDIIDVADKARDWTISIDNADFRASAFGMVVAGGVTVTGSLNLAPGEAITIAATVTVANGATFSEDGGVLDLVLNKFMTRVPSAPTTGQYSVNVATGVYTFAAADVGHAAIVTYTYTAATTGQTTTVNNSIQSASTPYKLRVYNPFAVAGSNGVVRLVGLDFASAHFEDLSLDFKVEDFAAHSLKGFASQDMIGATQRVVSYYSSEIG